MAKLEEGVRYGGVYPVRLHVPADTPADKPVTVEVEVNDPVITGIDVDYPVGCCALVHVQVFYGIKQVAPKPEGADYMGDGKRYPGPMNWKLPEMPCRLIIKAWNEDETYDHEPIVYINTAPEEAARPWGVLSDFIAILKRLMGV